MNFTRHLFGLVLLWASVGFGDELKVGDPAPDFSAMAEDGSVVRLSELAGRHYVVLYFYPKDDTPGCTKQACGLRDTYEELRGLDAVVLGVSFDSVESHRQFAAKYKLPFRLIADTDKKIAIAYGAATAESLVPRRMTLIINKAGRIAYVNRNVDPTRHAAEVRAALATMQD
ncbi:MAG: peroxiredoxin [Verrucomicrobiae bacterium]|nr:peroxiredoxin [Verrucomicrobiae bacterium]